MNSIKAQLRLLLLSVALIPLAALGVINYRQTTAAVNENIQESLLTIVNTKNDRLEQYIESTESIGQAISDTTIMKSYIASLGNSSSPDSLANLAELEAQINDLLLSFQEVNWGRYHHIFLVDGATKKISISPNHAAKIPGSPSSHVGEDTSRNLWAVKALLHGETTVSDYASWTESDHNHQMLFFPIQDASGATKAALGFELEIPYEKQILEENFQLGEGGSVFLVTPEGFPITRQGLDSENKLNSLAISEANLKGVSTDRRINNEGIEVIDLYLANDTYPWILVAEVEAKEALRSLNTIQGNLIVGLLITLIMVALISLYSSNLFVTPITKLTQQIESISQGNMNLDVAYLNRKDEVGKLAQAFNRMLVSIKLAMQQLESRD